MRFAEYVSKLGELNISNITHNSNISFIFAATTLKNTVMVTTNEIRRPNKRERKLAQESYTSLISSIEQLKSDQAEIEIEETGERIILPVKALNLLGEILKAMSQGKPI